MSSRDRNGLGLPPRRVPPYQPRPRQGIFGFFQFQAVFVVFFSLPFAFIALEPESGFDALVWIGIAVWAIGNVGTIVADRQLASWCAKPAEAFVPLPPRP